MDRLKLNIQRFADGKVVIDTELNTKNFESGLDRIKNTSEKAGSTIKNIVVGLGITKIVSTAIGQINASIDGAIARYDTLNNFPKVMQNLGISGEDAEKSIKKMSKKLAGLPTTLDQGASAVQRFTSANDDIEKSTDIFLALNNAIIAGGASSEIQASALEQLSQAYSKGKPDMMEWRTAMTAMPAQLKQVAQAMGYVDADELGEALRNGIVSMDDFMDAIVKLNSEGLEGFENFETQARNSVGGIRTAITVAKTQIVKGVADIIEALDIKLEELGFGKISDIISKSGEKIKKALNMVSKLIKGEISFKEFTSIGLKAINNFLDGINENIPKIIETAGQMINDFLTALIENLPQLIQTGMEMVSNLITGIAQQLPTLIPQAVQVILTLIEGILDNYDLIVDAGIQLIMGLADGLINALPVLIDKIPIIIEKLIVAIMENFPKLIEMGIELIIKLAEGLIKAIPQLVAKIPEIITAIVDGLGQGLEKVMEVGKNLVKGLWDGIKSAKDWILEKVEDFGESILNKLKSFFGIKSPSKVMRDEIGKYLAEGIGVGFEDELDSIYRDMQKSINFENAKLQANVESGNILNTVMNSTPIEISLDANVDMDSEKVGRLIAPSVSRTIKTGGGY